MKKAQKQRRQRMTIENGMKILDIFWRKSTGIYRKKQVHRDLMNDFDWAGKDKQAACKTLRVWTKN